MGNMQKISCRAMKNDAEALSDVLSNLPGAIEQMQMCMQELSTCWEGPAWTAFQGQVQKDIQNMQAVYQSLVELQKALGTGRNTYLKTEYDIYTDLKSLWI